MRFNSSTKTRHRLTSVSRGPSTPRPHTPAGGDAMPTGLDAHAEQQPLPYRRTLTYIRTLPNRDNLPVTQVAVSETLSDVATVQPLGRRSRAPAHAHAHEPPQRRRSPTTTTRTKVTPQTRSVRVAETVTCVCYSNAPEGASMNCVAAELASGEVRLFSSWDLRPVRLRCRLAAAVRLPPRRPAAAWEAEPRDRTKRPRILSAHALL